MAATGQTTKAHTPSMQPSDEATQQQLELAKNQGDAYGEALKVMTQEVALAIFLALPIFYGLTSEGLYSLAAVRRS